MGFGLICAGLLFLVIPTVNVIDIMPDCIGYILIFAGLKRLKYIDRYMYKAAHYALVLALINLTKPVMLVLCLLSDSSTVKSSNLTTATLIFLVIELIFGLIMMKNLFDGFTDLGFQYDDSSVTDKKLLGRFIPKRKRLSYEHSVLNPQSSERKRLEKGKRLHAVKYVRLPRKKAIFNGVDGLGVFSLVFFALHCILTLIPELTTLTYEQKSSGIYEQVSDASLRIGLIILCIVLGTVLGVAWYASVCKYVGGIKKDRVFIGRLEENYRIKVADNPDVMRMIKYGGFEKPIFAVCILGGDLFLDGADFIPDIIPAILLVFAALSVKKHLKYPRLSFAVLSLYVIVSAICLYCSVYAAGSYYLDTGLGMPLSVKLYGVFFPVSKALFALSVLIMMFSQYAYIKANFGRAPMYSRGKLLFGTIVMIIAQAGSAVGYFTDVISEELLHFPITINTATFDVNIYISFGSLIVYYIGVIGFAGGIEAISRKLAGKE